MLDSPKPFQSPIHQFFFLVSKSALTLGKVRPNQDLVHNHGGGENNHIDVMQVYTADEHRRAICHPTNMKEYKDGFKSFPSGHVSCTLHMLISCI
jgi:hypothetical protein